MFVSVSSAPLEETTTAEVSRTDPENPETLEELKSDERPLLEGDMLQPEDRNAVSRVWPTLEIPYEISPELAGRRDELLAAMAMVSKHTCVSFHQRGAERDHLLFTKGKGCASYVGFIGGPQQVFVGPRCTVGNVVHEILHALGFYHEHTRTDRGGYVTIVLQNVLPGKERNFKQRDGQTFGLPYDLQSILHYGRSFFSSNGLPTIIAKEDVEDMGQRVRLTETDVQRVRRLYKCDALRPPSKGRAGKDGGRRLHPCPHYISQHTEAVTPVLPVLPVL
uniref:Metalloendopeptidase n=1 Tax=Salarias fasciatus TaxID=181472 RepID=A0A672IA12_SALFA